MLTMVLAPVDRSRSAGSEEMSNPLRIATLGRPKVQSPWLAPALASVLPRPRGLPPDRKWAVPLGGVAPPSGLACPLTHRFQSLLDSSISGAVSPGSGPPLTSA